MPELLWIARGGEVVERQRRRAAGGVDGHVLAHGERQRDGLAGTEVAARRRFRQRRHRRRRGVDLRAGLGQAAQRQVGGIAGTVGNRGAVEIDRRCRQCSGVLPGRHRVAEGQRIAGAADITGGAEIVERQRRRAAGGVDGHVLAHGERQRDGLAGTEVAARR